MPVLTLVQAQALVCDTLVRCGTSPENAQSVANALVACEADGLKGHGLSRLPSYAAQVKVGKVKGDAKPQLSLASPGVLAVDAAHGFAFPALDLAIGALPDGIDPLDAAAWTVVANVVLNLDETLSKP